MEYHFASQPARTTPMPSDPTFKTREALEAWERDHIDDCCQTFPYSRAPVRTFLAYAERIRRVKLAHSHLLKERNDD
jgi:hypothetical protein